MPIPLRGSDPPASWHTAVPHLDKGDLLAVAVTALFDDVYASRAVEVAGPQVSVSERAALSARLPDPRSLRGTDRMPSPRGLAPPEVARGDDRHHLMGAGPRARAPCRSRPQRGTRTQAPSAPAKPPPTPTRSARRPSGGHPRPPRTNAQALPRKAWRGGPWQGTALAPPRTPGLPANRTRQAPAAPRPSA